MTAREHEGASAHAGASAPLPFPAVREALAVIEEAARAAGTVRPGQDVEACAGSQEALAALLRLREVRDLLAGWETGLIETAREAGASWAQLAHPLGVASRQAAERRYLRLRPGAPGTTGEQRIQATRDRRAADRTVTTWARGNAADLRQLAGRITALADLPAEARTPLTEALGDDDPATLLGPLRNARPHLAGSHVDLADQVDALTRHTDGLRRASSDQRRPVP